MKGPSLQKTAAVSAALHATIFLLTMIVLRNSNNFMMPSAYTVDLVSLPGGRADTARVDTGESVETVSKTSEPAETAVKEIRNTREEQKRIEDSIALLKSKKKIEDIVRLRKAVVSIKGWTGQKQSPVKASGQASGRGTSIGQAGEMTYADKVGGEIHRLWNYPDYLKKSLETVVAIKIAKDGTISIRDIEKRSGDRLFDKSVLDAIKMASPVTRPPYEMEIGIRFTP